VKIDKKVKCRLSLDGPEGNAFCLLGKWQTQARREGWTEEEIKTVVDEATNSYYNHLVATLREHCEGGGY